MQENALHGWKLPDGQHMRMSGYPAKTASLSFTRNGKWMASSGADAMVLWPFFGGGPMGKAPLELAGGDGIICTQVACNPNNTVVAGGFADGLVVIADIDSSRILPVVPPEHGPISTLAWNPSGPSLPLAPKRDLRRCRFHQALTPWRRRLDPAGRASRSSGRRGAVPGVCRVAGR